MGAICGFIDLKNSSVSIEGLKGMSSVLYHRGPHHESIYFSNGIGLAFRTLRSETFHGRDISETKDDNLFFVLDGDFINLGELQKELYGKSVYLKTPTFKILSDMYKKFGAKFIEKLNGPFSIAILDKSKNIIMLGRDRGGQKPLYYTNSNNIFAFASELKAFNSLSFVNKKLDIKSLYWYLAGGYISSPRSIYEKIYKLPEGTILIFDLNKHEEKVITYDEGIIIPQNSKDISEDVLAAQLDEILTKVVEEQVSRVPEPVGSFLSGGVDTSLLLSYLKKVTDKKIKTFTVGFKDPVCDERPYAKKIAEYYNVENYDYEIIETDFIDASKKVIDIFDEPFSDIGIGTGLQASKLAKEHTDIVFSGDGADFLFGNYDFKYLYLFYKVFPGFIRKPVLSIGPIFDNPIVKKKFPNMPIKTYLGEDIFFEAYFIKWKKNELEKLLGLKVDTREGKFYKTFARAHKDYLSNRILSAQYKTYGIDCVDTKSERTIMANSLNVINPYLDNRVIDFANSIPIHLKYKKGYGKYLNKKLLYKYIPKEYFERPKRGSGMPFGDLTNKGMKMLISQYLNPEQLKKEGIFQDIGVIEKAVKAYMSGDYFSGHKLWTLIIFEIWKEKNLN